MFTKFAYEKITSDLYIDYISTSFRLYSEYLPTTCFTNFPVNASHSLIEWSRSEHETTSFPSLEKLQSVTMPLCSPVHCNHLKG